MAIIAAVSLSSDNDKTECLPRHVNFFGNNEEDALK